MSDQKIIATQQENLRPLGSPGQRSFELISSTVRDRLGDRHASLFAEPVPTGAGDSVDWYTSATGTIVPLSSLDEGAQSAARDDLNGLVGDVRQLAETLQASDNGEDQRLGEALSNAVEIPSEDNVYVSSADGKVQPVLLNWAHLEDVVNPAMGVLAGTVKRPAPVVAPPPEVVQPVSTFAEQPPARRPFGWPFWLAWLLILLLVLWILWLLLQACGVTFFGMRPAWSNTCPEPVTISQPEEERTQQALLDRLHRLEQELAGLERDCEPVPPEPEPAPEPEPVREPEPEPTSEPEPPQDDIDARLEREDAQTGDLTFALAWEDKSDIDLHVTCPNGETVNFRKKTVGSCRGTLDVDANSSRSRATNDPIEHIVFNDPMEGTYSVLVRLFKNAGPDNHPFRLRVQIGSSSRILEGSVSRTRKSWTTTFQYPE